MSLILPFHHNFSHILSALQIRVHYYPDPCKSMQRIFLDTQISEEQADSFIDMIFL